MSLKKNLIANYLGQGWSALMGIAFIPLYIKYLGVEAYGLIGIFAILHASLALLDLGLTPALSREMARFSAGAQTVQSIRDLLRSLEMLGAAAAALLAAGIWWASDWLAINWLNAAQLPEKVIAQAIGTMGTVAALRFVENVYRSSAVGLQRQVSLNVINSLLATLKGVGSIAILAWVSPTIEAFFAWQGLVAILSIIALAIVVYGSIPAALRRAKFSWIEIAAIWPFAAGVMFITGLSLLLMQTDKILLTRLLSLEDFGYYSLAATVSGVLYLIVSPIDLAFFPRLTSQVSRSEQAALIGSFHLGAQLVSTIVGSAAVVVICFGGLLLKIWTGDVALAEKVAPVTAVLSVGTLLNCLMHMPYQLQLAHGWTRLTIRVNIVAVLILVPAMILVVPRIGALGAAWVWVVLNASYILIAAHLMFRRLLPTEKWRWYLDDLLVPVAAAALVAGMLRWSMPSVVSLLGQIAEIGIASALTLLAASFAAPLARGEAKKYIQKLRTINAASQRGR